jgi:hypothetical protein
MLFVKILIMEIPFAIIMIDRKKKIIGKMIITLFISTSF